MSFLTNSAVMYTLSSAYQCLVFRMLKRRNLSQSHLELWHISLILEWKNTRICLLQNIVPNKHTVQDVLCLHHPTPFGCCSTALLDGWQWPMLVLRARRVGTASHLTVGCQQCSHSDKGAQQYFPSASSPPVPGVVRSCPLHPQSLLPPGRAAVEGAMAALQEGRAHVVVSPA